MATLSRVAEHPDADHGQRRARRSDRIAFRKGAGRNKARRDDEEGPRRWIPSTEGREVVVAGPVSRTDDLLTGAFFVEVNRTSGD